MTFQLYGFYYKHSRSLHKPSSTIDLFRSRFRKSSKEAIGAAFGAAFAADFVLDFGVVVGAMLRRGPLDMGGC